MSKYLGRQPQSGQLSVICAGAEGTQNQSSTGTSTPCLCAFGARKPPGNYHLKMGVPAVLEMHNCVEQITKLLIEDADGAWNAVQRLSSLWSNAAC